MLSTAHLKHEGSWGIWNMTIAWIIYPVDLRDRIIIHLRKCWGGYLSSNNNLNKATLPALDVNVYVQGDVDEHGIGGVTCWFQSCPAILAIA